MSEVLEHTGEGLRSARYLWLDSVLALGRPNRTPPDQAGREMYIASVSGAERWSPDLTPYLIEPLRATEDRRFKRVVLSAPQRSGKTTALITIPLAISAISAPKDSLLILSSEELATRYVSTDLNRVIHANPALKRQIVHDENGLRRKRLKSGAFILTGWPSINSGRQVTVQRVYMSELDSYTQEADIDWLDFFAVRTRTHGSAGRVIVESSISAPLVNTDFDTDEIKLSPHGLPPTKFGIVPAYLSGTRKRWYTACPDCSELFLFEMCNFHIPDHGTDSERAAKACMLCQHCGSMHQDKWQLNQRGRWLSEGELEGAPRESDVDSYHLEGTAAAFQPFSDLAAGYLRSYRTATELGDFGALRVHVNSDQNRPFIIPAELRGDAKAEAPDLQPEHEPGTVPAACRWLVATIDCWIDGFSVAIWGYANSHYYLIGRKDIRSTKDKNIRPGEDVEAFEEVNEYLFKSYECIESGKTLSPTICFIDANGQGQTTTNAINWARRISGTNNCTVIPTSGNGNMSPQTKALYRNQDSAAKTRGVKWFFALHTNAGKDLVDAALKTKRIHIPIGMPSEYIAELAQSEFRDSLGRWKRRGKHVRTEMLDLTYMAIIACSVMQFERKEADGTAPKPIGLM